MIAFTEVQLRSRDARLLPGDKNLYLDVQSHTIEASAASFTVKAESVGVREKILADRSEIDPKIVCFWILGFQERDRMSLSLVGLNQ